MQESSWELPYPSRRSPVLARNVVATTQPLAVQAGLRMLLKGGNAADAAVATAITLTIVEPTMNGIGADAFVQLWDGTKLHGLNASGRSPAAWTPGRFAGRTAMPTEGVDAVTVPGAVSAWVEISRRFGKLPFESLFEPAIDYASNGYALSPIVALQWLAQTPRLIGQPGWAQTFLPGSRVPSPGQWLRFPDHAATLAEIARTKGESFYRGELAARIGAFFAREGGALQASDLAAHQSNWVEPICQDYRNHRVHEIPPNGQGIAALMALGILQRFDMPALPPDSVEALHLQIEAMKVSFSDVYAHVADPKAMLVSSADLLDPSYLRTRAQLVSRDRAGMPASGYPRASGTVYLTAADSKGMMVSWIQSNYMGFGSGVVVPGTGIALQNRGAGFSLVPGHPNQVAGGKRPFHTIIPGFLTKDGKAVMSFGVMGGDMQPQGHLQMMSRILDAGQNPQAAADAPRWKITKDGSVLVEAQFPEDTAAKLAARGHRVVRSQPDNFEFGSAQMILRLDEGYLAASEPRRDGQAAGF